MQRIGTEAKNDNFDDKHAPCGPAVEYSCSVICRFVSGKLHYLRTDCNVDRRCTVGLMSETLHSCDLEILIEYSIF